MKLVYTLAYLFSGSLAIDFERCRILDLTHTVKAGIPHWGGDFEQAVLVQGKFANSEYVEARGFKVGEHFGTHVDAPPHFYPRNSQRLHKMPLEKFIGPACVFDISVKVRRSLTRNVGLEEDDIKAWEQKHGKMPSGCFALVYSGNEFNWENPQAYLGQERENDTIHGGKFPAMNAPGITKEAAQFLVSERRIKGVGTDTLSIDVGHKEMLQDGAHLVILGHDLPAYENLNNLHRMPPFGASVALLPMKLHDGTGGPIRGMAVGWDGPNDPCRRENENKAS